jgi:HTH-type transcriptional regulator / antitoxin HigA
MDAAAGTREADELDLWATLVDVYEQQHDAILPPDPIEAIRFRMEQEGLTPRDLVPLLGSRSRVSEVLSRRRPLSLSMIRALHEHMGIPADVLIQPSAA